MARGFELPKKLLDAGDIFLNLGFVQLVQIWLLGPELDSSAGDQFTLADFTAAYFTLGGKLHRDSNAVHPSRSQNRSNSRYIDDSRGGGEKVRQLATRYASWLQRGAP